MKENENLLESSVRFLKIAGVLLLVMSLSRVYIFLYYGESEKYILKELFDAFVLGFRLDISIIAYISIIPVLVSSFQKYINQQKLMFFLKIYYILMVNILLTLLLIDLVFFSFFGEHTTLIIFGLFDDDTEALIRTAFENYNVFTFLGTTFVTSFLLSYIVLKILKQQNNIKMNWNIKYKVGFIIILFISIGLIARGSLGLFPLAKYLPAVSLNPFVNALSQSSVYSLVYAYKYYKKSKAGEYNLIKEVGYEGKIEEAFQVHTQSENINKEDLLLNLQKRTKKNKVVKKRPPHVVVVMVESFGMPLLDYQSETFNIMGKLQKHFKEDVVFTNFISSSNGTINSLEALLLNIPSRPKSTAIAQSMNLNIHYKQASARVYQEAGYETNFIYGGDLNWRSVGSFMAKQGFNQIHGKANIAEKLQLNSESDMHNWGVFDEYSYQYVLDILKNAKKPQFIFLLTTNNHPPYTIPSTYNSNSLEFSSNLKKHIKGSMSLAKKRIKDYAYALDMAGEFMDRFKETNLSENTLVAITADNNTVEGIMKYDEHFTQTKRVPFYIYIPKYLEAKEFNTRLASSHKDIFPTLYNLTLSDTSYISIGNDLANENNLKCGFNASYVLVNNKTGFDANNPKTQLQKECSQYYKASLAVTQYLLDSHKD